MNLILFWLIFGVIVYAFIIRNKDQSGKRKNIEAKAIIITSFYLCAIYNVILSVRTLPQSKYDALTALFYRQAIINPIRFFEHILWPFNWLCGKLIIHFCNERTDQVVRAAFIEVLYWDIFLGGLFWFTILHIITKILHSSRGGKN